MSTESLAIPKIPTRAQRLEQKTNEIQGMIAFHLSGIPEQAIVTIDNMLLHAKIGCDLRDKYDKALANWHFCLRPVNPNTGETEENFMQRWKAWRGIYRKDALFALFHAAANWYDESNAFSVDTLKDVFADAVFHDPNEIYAVLFSSLQEIEDLIFGNRVPGCCEAIDNAERLIFREARCKNPRSTFNNGAQL